MKQQSFWAHFSIKQGSFLVFHDESIPNKRWLLIGLLFIAIKCETQIRAILRYHRDQERYYGEIHFSTLPKSFDGNYGAKARVARRWVKAYQDGLYEDVFFSVLAVDRHSPAFDHRRFSKDFHAYNRFTAMALKAGIAWHLGPLNYDEVKIFFISDEKDRMSRPDEGIVDNFEEYIPYRAELDSLISQIEGKPYPEIKMSPVSLRDSGEDDLLQFTDLLLGATQAALTAQTNRPTKLELGKMVCRWYQDLRNPPWRQRFQMHRKFNLWGFPDDRGKPYNKLPLALSQNDGLLLFNLGNG